MKKGFLGIDESNNGRYPRIYVCTFSVNPDDIEKKSPSLEKIRKNQDLERVLGGKEFKYTPISKEEDDIIGQKKMSTIVFSEFIYYYMKKYHNIQEVIIDGCVPSSIINNVVGVIKNIMPSEDIPNISAIPHADELFPIVNASDGIANLVMHKYYEPRRKRKRENSKEHLQFRLTPKVEDYLEYLF